MALRSKRQNWIAWVGVLALAIVVVVLALFFERRFNFNIEASTTGIENAANQLTEIEVTNINIPPSNAIEPTPIVTPPSENTIKLSYVLKFSDCDNGQQPALLSNNFRVWIDGATVQGHLSGDKLSLDTGLTVPPKSLRVSIAGYEDIIVENPATSGASTLKFSKIDGSTGLCKDSSGQNRNDNLTLSLKLSVQDCPSDYRMNTNDLRLLNFKGKYYFDEISQILYIPMQSLLTSNNRQVELYYQGYYAKSAVEQTNQSATKTLSLKPLENARTIQCGSSSDRLDSYDNITKAIENQKKIIANTYKQIERLRSTSFLNSLGMGGNASVFISEAYLKLNQQIQRLNYLQNLANGYDLGGNFSQYTDPTQLIGDNYSSLFNNSANGYGNNNTFNPYTRQYTYDRSNPEMYSFGNDYSYSPDEFNSYNYNPVVSPYQMISPKCALAPTIASKVGTLLEKIPKVGSILSTLSNIFGLSYMYKNCSGYAAYNYGTNTGYNNRYYPYNNSYSPYNSVSNPSSNLSIIMSGPFNNLQTQFGRLPLGSAEMNNIWRWNLDARNNRQSSNNTMGYGCPTAYGSFNCSQLTNMDSARRQYCEWAIQNNCPGISY